MATETEVKLRVRAGVAADIENLGYRVRTLHGLAHDIVREKPAVVGLETRFSIIDEREDKLVEQIKQSVIQLIFFGNNTNTILRNSDYLSQKLGEPYNVLSKIFSHKTNHLFLV